MERDLLYFIPKQLVSKQIGYTGYPNFSAKIPYTQYIRTLYTVYPQTLTDPFILRYFFFQHVRKSNEKLFAKLKV